MTSIVKESLPEVFIVRGVAGLTETPLCVSLAAKKSIVVKALPSNSNWIMVGLRGKASTGWGLLAGEQSPPFRLESTDALGTVAGASNQGYVVLIQ
jgi:hypothetical protein